MSDLFLRPLFTWRAVVASQHGPSNPTTRHVLLTLGLYMSEKGDSCFPATRTLATATALSHRAIITHLKLASAEGWIGRKERPMKDGKGWRRMEYFATIPTAAEAAFRGEARSPAYRGEPGAPASGGEPGSVGGERGDTLVVNDVHLNTSVNSPKNTEKRATPASTKGRTFLPANFNITPEIRTWAKPLGLEPYLEAHLEWFKDFATSNGKQYRDWSAAFRNCVRSDWGGVRKALAGKNGTPRLHAHWWDTWPGIEAKARDLRIERAEHEAAPLFKQRVLQAAGEGPWNTPSR